MPGTITVSPTSFTNQGILQAGNGATLALGAAWTNADGGTISANAATLVLGDIEGKNAWHNAGTMAATDSTVSLAGSFTQADLGDFPRTGGVVNLAGTLTRGLALDAATGSWFLNGGTVQGGRYSARDGAGLVFTGSGILDGLTAGSDLDLAAGTWTSAMVRNGLTLDGVTVRLGDAASSD